MKINHTQHQQGFSQLILVGLVALGIITGTLLVQNRTNFLPQAANDCSELDRQLNECYQAAATSDECNKLQDLQKTCQEATASEPNPESNPAQSNNKEEGSIQNNKTEENNSEPKNNQQEGLNPVDPKKMAACGTNDCKDKLCAADEVTFCDNRSGTPRAIRKSGGYYDNNHPLKDANGCVFDFFEVSSKKAECTKSESKSGDVVYTTNKEAEEIDEAREKSLPERERAAGLHKDTTFCSEQASTTYNDAKVANNLARFYAIQKEAGGLCTPADLGVPYKDEVTVNGTKGRLMLCSSNDPVQLYWAISSYNDNSFIVVPENVKPKPDINNLQFSNLQKARCAAGLDQGDICKGV